MGTPNCRSSGAPDYVDDVALSAGQAEILLDPGGNRTRDLWFAYPLGSGSVGRRMIDGFIYEIRFLDQWKFSYEYIMNTYYCSNSFYL